MWKSKRRLRAEAVERLKEPRYENLGDYVYAILGWGHEPHKAKEAKAALLDLLSDDVPRTNLEWLIANDREALLDCIECEDCDLCGFATRFGDCMDRRNREWLMSEHGADVKDNPDAQASLHWSAHINEKTGRKSPPEGGPGPCGQPSDDIVADSREELEEAASRLFVKASRQQACFNDFLALLDCQAEITERNCRQEYEDMRDYLQARVDALETERDALQSEVDELADRLEKRNAEVAFFNGTVVGAVECLKEGDPGKLVELYRSCAESNPAKRIAELEAERDAWREAAGNAHEMWEGAKEEIKALSDRLALAELAASDDFKPKCSVCDRTTLLAEADRVRELATRAHDLVEQAMDEYVELPADAEGVPLHVGDLVELPDGGKEVIWLVSFNEIGAYVNEGDFLPSECRRIIDEALQAEMREYAEALMAADEGEYDGIDAKYAARIRNAASGG